MAAQYVTDETVFPTDCAETEKIMNSQSTYIPATQRPDGTWRKARRVKDGYIPQEEMPLYESKGKQWAKNKPTLPVGLNPDDVTKDCTLKGGALSKTIPGLVESETSSKSSKKKKKKKNDLIKEHMLSDSLEKTHISSMVNVSKTEPDKVTETLGTKSQPVTTDPAKRIRNLKKKLRDIDALKQKIESGELAKPEKEQLEKIARRDEIEAEIDELEFEMGNQ